MKALFLSTGVGLLIVGVILGAAAGPAAVVLIVSVLGLAGILASLAAKN